jgi:hypothetical protein
VFLIGRTMRMCEANELRVRNETLLQRTTIPGQRSENLIMTLTKVFTLIQKIIFVIGAKLNTTERIFFIFDIDLCVRDEIRAA